MATFPASLLILNGKGADNQPLRDAIGLLRDEGVEIHVRVTWEKGDAQRYVNEARQLGVETVIAGGGDGTINEVSAALIQCQGGNVPALGILPLGTANDFATSAGIPEALDKALKLAIAGNAVAIDIAQVNDKTCFINMATGGFGTRITTETPEKLKAALGGVSYFIHGLMRMDTLKPDRCEIRGENFHWQGDALVIGIGNGRQAGGGQQLCPGALINDGLLQLRIFTGEELLPALFSTLTQPEENPNIVDGASAWFDIQAPHEITFNLDGEPLSGQEFHIEILPNALRCRLPPDCPLLR
ncbi:lipid kinase YegS [Citrobacter koseri]|uniref:Probable lipid kinase YegS-like n=1 Tax=Citrobacter koseri TaxID=545 RepID=A0A3S4KJ86_CITKO|nr:MULTISPECIES: lipid kinase YegS [Citrobacter]EKU0538042.1 lipid kinase YegS [Citrobacter koseri]EKU8895254.1 lipid kinase YegS [Citrobacter koseri]EKX8765699.1 lipid kinase YegS [Citrobacter koseri]MBJ9107989.1 lipid kinase YegS [Citrobacter koseri]MBJ9353652.1 lipid kinase YegS [Citrobacter koseri]